MRVGDIFALPRAVLIRSSNVRTGTWSSETVILRPVCFNSLLPAAGLPRGTHVAFFFTSYVNADGAAGLMVKVLKSQSFVLRADHLICIGSHA